MIRPLRIVHTEASLGWGGQEIRVFQEMQAMRARGHDVRLAAQPGSRIYQAAKASNFPVLPISEKAYRFPDRILRLATWFLKNRVDVVNTHSSKDGWLGGIAARLAGVPCLIRSRHIDVSYPNRFMSRMSYHYLPHHALTTSELIRSKLIGQLALGADEVDTVPTGIDPEKFRPAHSDLLHRELGLPKGAPVLGMISVIRSWKGHSYFIAAAARAAGVFPQLRFIIAGEGPGYRYLPEVIAAAKMEDKIFCLGHREDVPELLNSLDGLVLPSTAHEGIPQIILQAHLCECPVIGTTIGGIPEVVEDGHTGRLVSPCDPEALAEAMVRLVRERDLSHSMAAKARKVALARNTLDVMCRRLEEIYARYVDGV